VGAKSRRLAKRKRTAGSGGAAHYCSHALHGQRERAPLPAHSRKAFTSLHRPPQARLLAGAVATTQLAAPSRRCFGGQGGLALAAATTAAAPTAALAGGAAAVAAGALLEQPPVPLSFAGQPGLHDSEGRLLLKNLTFEQVEEWCASIGAPRHTWRLGRPRKGRG
jgi:hypothetical protein